MPEAALQDYLREISSLIDDSHLEEAVLHCKQILKQYPRHVETYRLLGKALLEQQKVDDAVDVFHRVLSADPEDFIAHAGLAIIHKENNQLQDAAWHMERAFEVEPYNTAIRESLQDLIGRRDGLAPEALTLTPGALARVYVRGELYSQAINELRRLLLEEPDRVDLQVLLAEALWRDGQRIDAAEECTRILQHLPNCIKANAILGEVCLVTERIDEAQGYLRQVFELALPTATSVDPDTAVGIAFRAEHSPVLPEQIPVERAATEDKAAAPDGAADWVQDLDLGDEFVLEDTEPEWLGALEGDAFDVDREAPDSASVFAAAEDTSREGDAAETSFFSRSADQLPVIGELREETDWEGWLEVERESMEAQEASSPGDGSEFEEVGMNMMDQQENNEDEFPEAEDSRRPDDEASPGREDSLDWLDELQEASGPTQASRLESMDDDDLPDWLREGLDVAGMEGELDWLDQTQEVDPAADESAADSREPLPDWLGEELALESDEFAGAGDDLSWLDDIAAGQGDPLEEPPTVSWPEDDAERSEAPQDLSEAMDWLDELALAADDAGTDVQDQEEPVVGSELADLEPEALTADEAREDVDEAMAWLELLAAEGGADELVFEDLRDEADLESLADLGELPDDPELALAWLEGLADDAEAVDVAGGEVVDEQATPAAPLDVVAARAEAEAILLHDEESLGVEPGAEDVEMVEDIPDDPDEAMAWLEKLAARQGAPLDELPSLGEVDEAVEAPDWLAEEIADLEEDDVFYSEAVEETDDTLYEDIESDVVREGETTVFEEDEVETWPEEIRAAPEGDGEIDVLAGMPLGDESLEEDLPDWLSLEDEGEFEEFDWEEPAFDAPDWLQSEDAGVMEAERELPPEQAFVAEDEPVEQDAGLEEAFEAELAPVVDEPAEGFEEPQAEDTWASEPFEEKPEVSAEVTEDEPEMTGETEAEVAEPMLAETRAAVDPQAAQQALERGELEVALERYQALLESSDVDVATVIAELEQASTSVENQPGLLRLLGDAYNHNGQLQKALDAYRRALEML